jgi:iron complex outermembrane receptor protein
MSLKIYLLTILLLASFTVSFSQRSIQGTVTDLLTDKPLPNVSITLISSGNTTMSDADGKYKINVSTESSTLTFTLNKYISESISIDENTSLLDVSMILNTDNLSEVVLVGSRFKPRSIIDSPVPIDNIQQEELRSAGHHDLDMMMMYNIPSFNSSNQAVSDATAHMNPADLRGLGPSRTLILINGKRKNYSSLVYINDTPGKGEVGVDLTTIPISAIDRVEILRNGASAQYGSDAIAGVVNLVLKSDQEYAEFNTISGLNQEGDGLVMGFDAHIGVPIEDKGFISVSTNFKKQEKTNRAGNPNTDAFLGGIVGSQDIVDGSNMWVQSNPSLGMVVGQPDMTSSNLFFNANYNISDQSEIYAFGGTTYRNGMSFGVYRPPYIADDYGLFSGLGFLPTFNSSIHDVNLTLGLKGTVNGWNYDVSTTRGRHEIDYTISNTLNDSLGITSPTRFDAGGYNFSQTVNNLDVAKNYGNIDIGFGFEFRNETFIAESGESNSYIGNGAISFPGLQPSNEVDENRNNLGIYFDASTQITDRLLLGGSIRYETYSDFGSRYNWMINGKIDLIENKVILRGSMSTGFRAPSLHQIHLSNVQTLISRGTISNQGTFRNSSTVLRSFNVPKLKEETSVNLSAGLSYQLSEKFHITADYFRIDVDDRIVFTGAIGDDGDPNTITQTESILNEFNITSFKFFTNAIDTRSNGIDFVASYNDTSLGRGEINLSLNANYINTEIRGDLKTSGILESEGNSLFDRKEQARITSARPKSKIILTVNYNINKFNFGLFNTHFGEVTWQHASDPSKDQTFSSKVITDLNINYQLTQNVNLSIGANNLFDIYPDEIKAHGDPETDLGGRFKYSWEVNQFGFNGRFIFGKIQFTL